MILPKFLQEALEAVELYAGQLASPDLVDLPEDAPVLAEQLRTLIGWVRQGDLAPAPVPAADDVECECTVCGTDIDRLDNVPTTTCGPACEAAERRADGWDQGLTLPWVCPFCAAVVGKPTESTPDYPSALEAHAPACHPSLSPCAQLTPFFDGELSESSAETYCRHLAGCSGCIAALGDELQLRAAFDGAAMAGRFPGWTSVRDLLGECVPLLVDGRERRQDLRMAAESSGAASAELDEMRARETTAADLERRVREFLAPFRRWTCSACRLDEPIPPESPSRIGDEEVCVACGNGRARVVVRAKEWRP